jgi:endonuclease G, mitochondrial
MRINWHNMLGSLLAAGMVFAAVLAVEVIPFASVLIQRSELAAFPQPEPPPTADPRPRVIPRKKPIEHDPAFPRLGRLAKLSLWGVPDNNYIRSGNGSYLIGMPDRTRCPRWTLQRLTKASLGDADRNDDEWRPDPQVPKEWRVFNEDYKKSEWDRGHLVAAKDLSANESLQAETYFYSNAMPQTVKLNRGIWANLEQYVRGRVESGQVAWVLTMPIWKRNAQTNICARTIGNGVWVPTHCAKAVLWSPDERRSVDAQTLALDCWLIPNEDELENNFLNYKVSGDDLEGDAGINLFADLPDDVEKKLESAKPTIGKQLIEKPSEEN